MTHIRWEPDGEAEITAVDGDRIELRSTRAFPPGARPRGKLLVGSVHASMTPAQGAEPAGAVDSAGSAISAGGAVSAAADPAGGADCGAAPVATPAPASAPAPAPAPASASAPAPAPASFWMKVHGSRREADGRYRVVGRLLDATRELRDRVARLAAPPPASAPPAPESAEKSRPA